MVPAQDSPADKAASAVTASTPLSLGTSIFSRQQQAQQHRQPQLDCATPWGCNAGAGEG